MALGTIEHTESPAETHTTQDQYTPEQEPAIPTAEDWENERLYSSLGMPQQWETPETTQPTSIEQAPPTNTVNQLSELIRLQVADTQIQQLMIQLELLEMIERLQNKLRQRLAPQNNN